MKNNLLLCILAFALAVVNLIRGISGDGSTNYILAAAWLAVGIFLIVTNKKK